jgi:hypothetical protein
MVAHTYNPSYLGGRDMKTMLGGQLGKIWQDPISKTSQVCWLKYLSSQLL